ncbi:MAG: hypothetical protein U9Q82_01210 [Chloroflexota bacterium]|nr:hypothetical protein [Chloroflexota bacterium]
MMTLSLTPQITTYLEPVAGKTPNEKVLSLLESYLAAQIRACEREINEYEIKYRSPFSEFAEAWEQGHIQNRYSHEIERDYMEWEGLVAEKGRWLEHLRNLPAQV